jgi:hypothetical protein
LNGVSVALRKSLTPPLSHDFIEVGLACLRAEGKPDLLVARRRRADHRRRRAEDPPNRIQVILGRSFANGSTISQVSSGRSDLST